MSDALTLGAQALALVLVVTALATALGAIMSRSLLAMCAYIAAAGALAAAAALLLRSGEGALALALFAAAWAPVLVLSGVSLSARSAKPVRSRTWLSVLAVAGTSLIILAPLLAAPAAAPATAQGGGEATPGLGFWAAPLILVAAAGCVGLLGYGERGAFGRGRGA
jgi:hypothetical protein